MMDLARGCMNVNITFLAIFLLTTDAVLHGFLNLTQLTEDGGSVGVG